MSHADILLVEDDADLLKLIALRLRSAGYAVRTATSGERALTEMEAARPDVLVTDLKMDGMDGMQLFDAVQRHSPVLPVIILTAHGTIPDAVSATRRGVFGFLPKPFEPRTLLAQIEEALAATRGARSGATLDEDRAWRADIVSQNPKMEEILSQARLVAASDAAVIIRGASGTGKELLARAIHKASSRRRGPFVPVNCAAIPENLLESELFGYRKGAFTGALRDQNGLMQSASGGTLMLDEIGDMPVAVQAKLLRVLAEGEVRPVGATQAVPVGRRLPSGVKTSRRSPRTACRRWRSATTSRCTPSRRRRSSYWCRRPGPATCASSPTPSSARSPSRPPTRCRRRWWRARSARPRAKSPRWRMPGAASSATTWSASCASPRAASPRQRASRSATAPISTSCSVAIASSRARSSANAGSADRHRPVRAGLSLTGDAAPDRRGRITLIFRRIPLWHGHCS